MNIQQQLRHIANPLALRIVPGHGCVIRASEKPTWIDAGPGRWTEQVSGLELTRHVEHLGDAAVRITGRLRNPSQQRAPALHELAPLHVAFEVPAREWVHHHAHGGTTDWQLPPQAFQGFTTFGLSHSLYLQSHALGRSSNEDLPLLLSVVKSLNSGLFVGMEWSGEWVIQFHKPDEQDARVELRAFPKSHGIVLEPGEEIEIPAVHLGFFTGDFADGTNALRRHLVQHVCPQYQKKPPIPRVSYDHWFGIENRVSTEVLKKQVDRAAELGVEIFVHDAAWMAGGFPEGVGNWTELNLDKHPQGLEPLAEYVRSKGMQFGLWFEIERAEPGTRAVREHPEIFVETFQIHAGGTRGKQFHLNLARRDAQEWAIQTIGSWVRRLDLHWIRFDYNIEPNPFWHAVDFTGKIQFQYMQGLYRVFEALLSNHPDLLIEQCASGGRRMDLGTIRRAHTFWFSDHTHQPDVCRHMQARANRFLPGHLLNSSVMVAWGRGDRGFDDRAVLSRMLGKLAFDGDIASWSESWTKRARHWSDAFKRVRGLFLEDFHQLTPVPAAHADWDVVEFVHARGDEAAVFAFAGEEAGEQHVRLRGLQHGKNFRVQRVSDGAVNLFSGAALLRDGLPIALNARGAEMWRIQVTD